MSAFFSAVPGRLRGWLVQVLVPVIGSGLFLFGVIVIGIVLNKLAADQRRPIGSIDFADIECEPPPGWERERFLGEVQFQSQLPPRLPLPDKDLKPRLERAFAQHSWVESVEECEIGARQVRVRLVYRTPVLRVKLPDRTPLVDSHGIVMRPLPASATQVPVLVGKVTAPGGADGTRWGNTEVEAAARTAGFLKPYQEQLHLEEFVVRQDGLVIKASGGAIIRWGHAPDAETPDEPSAGLKLTWLLDYCTKHDGSLSKPAPGEHDVRQQADALWRKLP